MGQWNSLELIGLALDGIAALAVLLWLAWARKRMAADTVHAREQAAQIVASAGREAEATQRHAELAGKERAHALLVETERTAREMLDAARATEQHAADQLRTAGERSAALLQREQDLVLRLDDVQQRLAASAALDDQVRARLSQADARHAEVIVELQRVARLTSEEA